MIISFLKLYEWRTYFLVCFTIVGLVTSKAVMSIGVIALFVSFLIDLLVNPNPLKETLRHFVQQKRLFALSFLFFASLIALTYSQDKALGFTFVLNKLSLLVVPLAFSRIRKITSKEFQFILLFFIATLFISSIAVWAQYLQNYELNNLLLKRGQAIWVPFQDHIRYSSMLVFAFVSSVYLFILSQKKYAKVGFILLSLYFFALVHFLSARSGLLVLYLCLLTATLFYLWHSRKYMVALLALVFIVSMPFLAYQNIESFRNRIAYMRYDWEQYQQQNIGSNSDARRMISYKISTQLIQELFPLGAGTGSHWRYMVQHYEKDYPQLKKEDRVSPHNQFLFTFLDYGLLGFFALCVTLFYPLFSLKNKNLYYILFWIIAFTPLLFDISLEMQLGITFFALFSSFILKYINLQEQNA